MASSTQQPEVTNAIASADAEAEEAPEVQASRISAAIARARSALEDVKANVSEYDGHYKASETASAHLAGAIARSQAAFDELATTASTLKDKAVEIPTKALSRTLAAANSSLENIGEVAAKYDEKFKLSSTVQKAVALPWQKCSAALAEVSQRAASLSAAANAQLQGVNQGLCSRVVSIASGGANMIFCTAAALENRYAIEEKASSAGTKVADKAQQLDEKFNVKERVGALATGVLTRAGDLDSKVTGGKLTPAVLTAYEKGLSMATDGLAYVQTNYESAKQQRQGLSEAKVEGDVADGKEGQAEAATTNASSPANSQQK